MTGQDGQAEQDGTEPRKNSSSWILNILSILSILFILSNVFLLGV